MSGFEEYDATLDYIWGLTSEIDPRLRVVAYFAILAWLFAAKGGRFE